MYNPGSTDGYRLLIRQLRECVSSEGKQSCHHHDESFCLHRNPPLHRNDLAFGVGKTIPWVTQSYFVKKKCRLRYLLGASIWFAGGTLQSLVKAVQLVAEIAESNLLGPELLLGFYFLCLPLLFFIF
jgi:hypothetical protein